MDLFYVFVSGYEFRRLVYLGSLFYVFVSGYEFRRLGYLVSLFYVLFSDMNSGSS